MVVRFLCYKNDLYLFKTISDIVFVCVHAFKALQSVEIIVSRHIQILSQLVEIIT